MIISASRRMDIPAFYSDWFFNRLRKGYVCARNPMNLRQVSKISLDPDVVGGIVFRTKDPTPMMHRLDELKDYVYYFQFTEERRMHSVGCLWKGECGHGSFEECGRGCRRHRRCGARDHAGG